MQSTVESMAFSRTGPTALVCVTEGPLAVVKAVVPSGVILFDESWKSVYIPSRSASLASAVILARSANCFDSTLLPLTSQLAVTVLMAH